MLYVAGKTFQVGALIFSTITVLASGMAAHAGVARLMYVMGRDGVFPKSFFGYVHPKWRTPAMNIILVGAIALLAINFDLVMATALINFGALVAFTFVNLSVISQFWIREKRNKTLKDHFQYLFLPMCGALTVGALWVNLEESSMVLGLIWAGIGLIYLACVTKSFRKPGSTVRRRRVIARIIGNSKTGGSASGFLFVIQHVYRMAASLFIRSELTMPVRHWSITQSQLRTATVISATPASFYLPHTAEKASAIRWHTVVKTPASAPDGDAPASAAALRHPAYRENCVRGN